MQNDIIDNLCDAMRIFSDDFSYSIDDLFENGKVKEKFIRVGISDGRFGYEYRRGLYFYDGESYDFSCYDDFGDGQHVGFSRDEDILEYFKNVLHTAKENRLNVKFYGMTYDEWYV
jgi:hypothetical protein